MSESPDRAEVSAVNYVPPSITCPVCKMTSYSLKDITEGYCGRCHDWTSPPAPRTATLA